LPRGSAARFSSKRLLNRLNQPGIDLRNREGDHDVQASVEHPIILAHLPGPHAVEFLECDHLEHLLVFCPSRWLAAHPTPVVVIPE